MTVAELYRLFDEKYPVSLREEWDNDGLMLSPDTEKTVKRVLVALDVSEAVAKHAVENRFDLIVSHHPLIFTPLSSLTPDDPIAKRAMRLLSGGVSVFSFHTRLDAAKGGVNDTLAAISGLTEVTAFGGENLLGRVGVLPKETTLSAFANGIGKSLSTNYLFYAGNRPVRRVAVVGGSGKSMIGDALKTGADTFLSGRFSYEAMIEAEATGMNLVEAGHFATENPVTEVLRHDLLSFDPTLTVETLSSYNLSCGRFDKNIG